MGCKVLQGAHQPEEVKGAPLGLEPIGLFLHKVRINMGRDSPGARRKDWQRTRTEFSEEETRMVNRQTETSSKDSDNTGISFYCFLGQWDVSGDCRGRTQQHPRH